MFPCAPEESADRTGFLPVGGLGSIAASLVVIANLLEAIARTPSFSISINLMDMRNLTTDCPSASRFLTGKPYAAHMCLQPIATPPLCKSTVKIRASIKAWLEAAKIKGSSLINSRQENQGS
eukprot:TRINITY_DN9261_c0_g3_i2.p2 TRINITY_DN9261_c0_g3~~TRINITY_DN9261_c0_g3_i2.p2  ORF type:complete len:122 (-),score=15.95 TRINITY_DN9261_c0_g3_i2:20-385(-)